MSWILPFGRRMSSSLAGFASCQSPVSWSLISGLQRGLSWVVTSWHIPRSPQPPPHPPTGAETVVKGAWLRREGWNPPPPLPRHSLHVLLPWYSCSSGPNNINHAGSGGEAHAAAQIFMCAQSITPAPTSQEETAVHLCQSHLVSASIIIVCHLKHLTWRFFPVTLMSDQLTRSPSATIKCYSILRESAFGSSSSQHVSVMPHVDLGMFDRPSPQILFIAARQDRKSFSDLATDFEFGSHFNRKFKVIS